MTARAADLRRLRQMLKRQAQALRLGDLSELARDHDQVSALTDRLERSDSPANSVEAGLLAEVQGLARANARMLTLRLEGRKRALTLLAAIAQGQGLATYARDGSRQPLAAQPAQLEQRR
jgi:hypothetical protein